MKDFNFLMLLGAYISLLMTLYMSAVTIMERI